RFALHLEARTGPTVSLVRSHLACTPRPAKVPSYQRGSSQRLERWSSPMSPRQASGRTFGLACALLVLRVAFTSIAATPGCPGNRPFEPRDETLERSQIAEAADGVKRAAPSGPGVARPGAASVSSPAAGVQTPSPAAGVQTPSPAAGVQTPS